MNINDYIASGILEQYVSGTASAQERQEVECMSHIYPEIHAELIAVQNALEAFAQAQAVAPPAHVRKNIFDAIDALEAEEKSSTTKTTISKEVNLDQKNIAQEPTKQVESGLTFNKSNNSFKAAAAVLFLISGGLGYMLFQSQRNASNFEKDLANIKTEIQNRDKALATKNTQLAIVQNNAFRPIIMDGIPTKSPTSKATIYFDKNSSEVFVAINNLPTPAAGKQYQLWAIVDGKPTDLGMIEKGSNDFQKMKQVKNPQAFAVTLEKDGGVISPTMEEMYVLGKVEA